MKNELFVDCHGRILRTDRTQMRRLLADLASGKAVDPNDYGTWYAKIDYHLAYIDDIEASLLLEEDFCQ